MLTVILGDLISFGYFSGFYGPDCGESKLIIYLAYEFTNFIVSQVHVPCCAVAKEGMLMVNAGVKSDGKDLNVTSRHPIVIHLIVQVMDSASLVNVNVHVGLVDQTVKMASQKPFSF